MCSDDKALLGIGVNSQSRGLEKFIKIKLNLKKKNINKNPLKIKMNDDDVKKLTYENFFL